MKVNYIGCVFDGHRDGKGYGNVYDFIVPECWSERDPKPGDRVLAETAGGDQVVTVVTNIFEGDMKEGYRPIKDFVWADGEIYHDVEVAKVSKLRGLS